MTRLDTLANQMTRSGNSQQPGRRREVRLLLTSAGRRVELLNCFRASAAQLGVQLTVLACDLNPDLSAACTLADHSFTVPRADDPAYEHAVLDLCRQEGVSLLIPTIDPELEPLSRLKPTFAAAGTRLVIGSSELIEIARDKAATADFLADHGIPSPRTAALTEAAEMPWRFPVFVKPRHGSASRGIRIVQDAAALQMVTEEEPLIVQERLTGPEYTVNMYFDSAGELRCAIPHVRLQVRAGEVEKGRTCRVPELEDLARKLAGALPAPQGPMCFQAMADANGRAALFEINARFGGGYPLAHQAGAMFSRWILEEHLGLPSTANNDWREGVSMLRYDAAIFLEP